MARKAKENCIICGERVENGRAVFCVGVEVDRPFVHHYHEGTVEVRFRNRNPRGIMHEECLNDHLLVHREKTKKIKLATQRDPLILRGGLREWDE